MSTTITEPTRGSASARATRLFAVIAPDPIGQFLGTGFNRFATAHGVWHVRGLFRERGDLLEILAVDASHQEKGLFRAFIAKAKEIYPQIAILEIFNPWLEAKLAEYGFVHFAYSEIETKELTTGMIWQKSPQKSPKTS